MAWKHKGKSFEEIYCGRASAERAKRGRPCPPEVALKISLAQKGRPCSPARRERIRVSLKARFGGKTKLSAWETNEWLQARIEAIRRDKKCILCGTEKKILVHHKSGNEWEHCLQNLITLCRTCHNLVHHTARKWRTGSAMELARQLVESLHRGATHREQEEAVS